MSVAEVPLRLADPLEDIGPEHPQPDRPAVEAALWQHLSVLGAETDSFVWVSDIEAGFEVIRDDAEGHRGCWEPSSSGSWRRISLWHPDRPVSYPDRELDQSGDPIGVPIVQAARASLGRRWRVRGRGRRRIRYRLSYTAVPDPVSVYRLARAAASEAAIVRAGRPERETFERLDHDPEDRWANSRIDSRWQTAIRTFESARYRAPALEPMTRAFTAGLLCFWVVESKSWRQRHCVCVPRPRLHVADGRLHSDDEPAVSWTNGVSYWFWEGISVPQRALQQDGRVRFSSLVWTPNAERRRVILERLGYERFLEAAGAKLAAQDDYGKLWRTELELDGEPLVAVEVVNSTAEPDGTHRRYFLRVPPDTRTAREAVAWTFGFEHDREYRIAIES